MACSETGTSTSNTSGGKYQVFLSFRGPDTRRTFTNSLYHVLVDAGIRVFMDDEKLQPGERISVDLLQAIDDSKIYIPIFTKTYASSRWCLRELAKMVENTYKFKEDGRVILPIFYNVTPNDVKLKTPLYHEAISNLKQKMEDQKDIKTRREALKEVGGIKGWELENYSGDGELIQEVVEAVVVKLETRKKRVTEDLVGMEDQIAAMNDLLDINSGGVRLIVIYGMGGIGKTTLAKIIFNQLCPLFRKNCIFLHDVRERTGTEGLVKLHKQLLSNISHSRVARNIGNIDQGIDTIEETICNKKVLIVLDDVSEGNHIQEVIGMSYLSPGTRILVTTRDKRVLKIRGFNYEILPYEMKGLSKKDALQLFSKHAFDGSSPRADYYTLSKGIVSTTGGLPLALVAIGSMLFHHEEKTVWEETLQKLRKTPHEGVLGKLRISYDALNMEQKQIFLDVACFCIGHEKTDLICAWKDCGYMPETAIKVLINSCMIDVLDNNSFWMHDQFRDLGLAIVNEENLQYPGKRTGLWDRDNIICELRSTEIKESVQALRLLSQDPITVTSEEIKRFPRIRFLSLHNVNCQGDFMGCLSELRWINLHYSHVLLDRDGRNQRLKATNLLHLENAVVVNLFGLQFTGDAFKSLIKRARKLKVLTIECNDLIHETPTFPEDSVLEKLTIGYCDCFSKIDCSIGNLRCLTDLSVEECPELRKLPEQIGELRNLRHLSLRDCFNLIELPDSVSKLESLMKLDVIQTSIKRLPDSIGRLPSLPFVHASGTLIEKLPSTMSEFRQLQTLDLIGCDGIEELPMLPRSLTALLLRSTSLLTIPNLLYLTNLVELNISGRSNSMAVDT